MSRELQIFNNPEFGQIRTMEVDGAVWFVGKDVAGALGYKNTRVALQDNVDEEDKGVTKVTTSGGAQDAVIINESGLYALILGSKLESAKKFKRWVTSEVLPALRKTGSYTMPQEDGRETERAMRSDAMLRNAKAKQASLLLKMAEVDTLSATYKTTLIAKAAEVLTGEELIPLPKVERRTYSAEEIGKMFGVSGNKIGRMANQNGLKTPEFGEYQRDKSRFSCREVDTWRYYDTAIPVLEGLLNKN